jgi:hypothetical protein
MKQLPQDDRNVGGMAESQLENWAHQVGITPNKVSHDKEGWDYFLQFPFETNISAPTLDQRSSRIECLIQVKGTDTDKRRESISLSNWERLVRSPLPSFFLVINYASQNQPSEAHLIHVNKRWIESVLHKLRKLRPEEAKKLYSKTLDLTWMKIEKLDSFDGEGLKKAILSYVNVGMAEYCKEKLEIQKNAGNPIPSLLEITSVFNSEEEYWNSLIDFAIGLKKELPTSKMILKEDIRFGIPASVREETEGLISITRQPLIECNITFKNGLNTLVSSFPAELYSPYWFFNGQEIPKIYFKERAVFEIGNVIIRSFNHEASVNLNFAQAKPRKSIADHANLWQVILIISELSGITVEITSKDNLLLGSGKLNSPLESNLLDRSLLEIAHIVDNAYFVARNFNFPIGKEVHLSQIMKQEKVLSELRQLCDVNFQINALEGAVRAEAKLTEEVAVPLVRRIIFDDVSLLVAVAVAGQINIINVMDDGWEKYAIEKPRRVIQKHMIISNDNFSNEHVEKMLNEIIEKLDAQGVDTIISEDYGQENLGQ